MPTARLLASYTADEAEKSQAQESAARKDSDYFSTDGDIIDLKTILRDENRTLAGTLIHRSDLFDLQQTGKLQGNLKPSTETPIEWDHVVFDLSSYGDQAEKAHEIIRDTFRAPSYTATKNQGGGRFQTMQIKGKRGVIDWGVHKNREDGLTHSHLFIHRYVVDKETRRICPPVNLQTKLLANAELEQVNRALLTHGLAPLESLDLGISQTRTQTMPKSDQYEAAQAGVNAVLSGTDTLQVLQTATASPAAVGIIGELKGQELLARGLDAARSAAAAAAEQYKAATERAAQIELALQAMQHAKTLEQKLAAADAKILEQTADMTDAVILIEQQQGQIQEQIELHQRQIQEQSDVIETQNGKIASKEETISELNLKVSGLENDYSNISEELNETTGERDTLTTELNETNIELESERQNSENLQSKVNKLDSDVYHLQEQSIRTTDTLNKERLDRATEKAAAEVEKNNLYQALNGERTARQNDWATFDKSLNQITGIKDTQISALEREIEALKKQVQTQAIKFASEFNKVKMQPVQQMPGAKNTDAVGEEDDDGSGGHKGQTGG